MVRLMAARDGQDNAGNGDDQHQFNQLEAATGCRRLRRPSIIRQRNCPWMFVFHKEANRPFIFIARYSPEFREKSSRETSLNPLLAARLSSNCNSSGGHKMHRTCQSSMILSQLKPRHRVIAQWCGAGVLRRRCRSPARAEKCITQCKAKTGFKSVTCNLGTRGN